MKSSKKKKKKNSHEMKAPDFAVLKDYWLLCSGNKKGLLTE